MVRATHSHGLRTLPRSGVGGGGSRVGSICPRVASTHRDGERVRGILMRAGPGMTTLSGKEPHLRCSVGWCAWSVTSRSASPPQPTPPFLKCGNSDNSKLGGLAHPRGEPHERQHGDYGLDHRNVDKDNNPDRLVLKLTYILYTNVILVPVPCPCGQHKPPAGADGPPENLVSVQCRLAGNPYLTDILYTVAGPDVPGQPGCILAVSAFSTLEGYGFLDVGLRLRQDKTAEEALEMSQVLRETATIVGKNSELGACYIRAVALWYEIAGNLGWGAKILTESET